MGGRSKTYRPWQVDQPLLLPPSVQELVPSGHLAHFLRDLERAAAAQALEAEAGAACAAAPAAEGTQQAPRESPANWPGSPAAGHGCEEASRFLVEPLDKGAATGYYG